MTAGPTTRWLVAVVALAVALAGCTGERSPSPQLTPAEQRLQFGWHEQVEVPESTLAAVEMAREWLYWYYVWNNDPSTVPRYLTKHTGHELLRGFGGIERINGPPMAGRVRLHLVEVEADERSVSLGLCKDDRELRRIDESGHPIPDVGYVSGGRLQLARLATGGWIADKYGWTADLEDRCDEPDVAPPLPTASPEWTGPPSTER